MFNVGDWVALGLANGQCPLGQVEAVGPAFVRVALVSALTGLRIDQSEIVAVSQIVEASLLTDPQPHPEYPDGTTDLTTLWDFQRRYLLNFQGSLDAGWRR